MCKNINTGKPEYLQGGYVMALSNLSDWTDKKAASVCGAACGAADKPEEKPAACGSACGAADK